MSGTAPAVNGRGKPFIRRRQARACAAAANRVQKSTWTVRSKRQQAAVYMHLPGVRAARPLLRMHRFHHGCGELPGVRFHGAGRADLRQARGLLRQPAELSGTRPRGAPVRRPLLSFSREAANEAIGQHPAAGVRGRRPAGSRWISRSPSGAWQACDGSSGRRAGRRAFFERGIILGKNIQEVRDEEEKPARSHRCKVGETRPGLLGALHLQKAEGVIPFHPVAVGQAGGVEQPAERMPRGPGVLGQQVGDAEGKAEANDQAGLLLGGYASRARISPRIRGRRGRVFRTEARDLPGKALPPAEYALFEKSLLRLSSPPFRGP